jgi:acyl carrier protein
MADTFEQVKKIVVDLLGVEPEKVTREARFREDLEADSLDLVELIMEFEERFGETVSDEDAQQLMTVGQVVDYVDQHMVAGA